MGAYSLLFQCPVLLLDSTEESYVRTHHTFPLRSLLLPILTEDSMHSVVNSLPHLEELSKENQRLTWSPGHLGTSLCNLHGSRRIVLTQHLSRGTSLKGRPLPPLHPQRPPCHHRDPAQHPQDRDGSL